MPDNRYEVLDVQAVTVAAPEKAIKTFAIDKAVKTIKCDILIAGGGVGAVAAATKLSSAHPHLKVCLTEETDWLGGQMTAQGVSALDENYLIETAGACRSYQNFRANVRAIYKNFKLSKIGQSQEYLHPGTSWVTYLSFEPKFALQAFDMNLNAAINSGALQLFMRTKVIRVRLHKSSGKSLQDVLAVNLDSGQAVAFEPKVCLDATELGDLLPLAGIPYRIGSDSRADTGEAHAPVAGDKENVQDFVYPFVVDFKPGTDNTIAKPAKYDEFKDSGKFSFDGYKMFESVVQDNRELLPFWTYRRLVARENFDDPLYPFDVAMINWDSNDLRGYNIIDQKRPVEAERLALAKSLSLGFLYWLQTTAARDDGGQGYPELSLRTDVLGTADGLSKYPYIREARRAKTKRTIVESDIVSTSNPLARAKQFDDTVGIGFYPVDIHGMQEVPGAGQQTKPFQIPMAALVPEEGGHILPACKNIGVTHITNGAYRLHPVEWALGEAQAEVAAYCIEHHLSADHVLADKIALRNIQRRLIAGGSPLIWFDDVPTTHPAFEAIQYATLAKLMPLQEDTLHFQPEEPLRTDTLAAALYRLLCQDATTYSDKIAEPSREFASELKALQKLGYLKEPEPKANAELDARPALDIDPAKSVTFQQLEEIARLSKVPLASQSECDRPPPAAAASAIVSRGLFAGWLYAAVQKSNIKSRH